MNNKSTNSFRKNLYAISLIIAPLLLLIGDTLMFAFNLHFAFYLLGKAALALFVFAIFVLIHLLRERTDRLGLIGGAIAIIGAISGTTLFSFTYFYNEILRSGFDAAMLQSVEQTIKQVYLIMVLFPLPGLFFPIGLLILSIGLFWKNAVPRWTAIALGLGAILFPMGRIPGILPISIVSDILFLLSMSYIGWRIFIRYEISKISIEEFRAGKIAEECA